MFLQYGPDSQVRVCLPDTTQCYVGILKFCLLMLAQVLEPQPGLINPAEKPEEAHVNMAALLRRSELAPVSLHSSVACRVGILYKS